MTVRVGVIGVGIMGADHARKLNGCVADAAVTARRRRPASLVSLLCRMRTARRRRLASLVSLLCRMRHRDDKRDENTTLQMRIDKLFQQYFIISCGGVGESVCRFSRFVASTPIAELAICKPSHGWLGLGCLTKCFIS